MSFYALKMSLDYIFQGVISKIKIYEYIFSIKNHLYLLNNELGIKIFVKNFIIQFTSLFFFFFYIPFYPIVNTFKKVSNQKDC